MDYKSYVGNPKHYDLIGKIVFQVLLDCGLKPNHKLLDIGCGSLRIGKYIINYLKQSHYYGTEPNNWLVLNACEKEKVNLSKYPIINGDDNFDLQLFKEKFDFILANSIFIHACKSQIEKCFDEVNIVLSEKGKFIFNYIEGKDNEKTKWSYPSAITYTKKYIEGLLKDFNFKYLDVKYPGKQKFIMAWKGEK